MDFDTLPKAIADFWQFLFAPIITVALIVLVACWIGGRGFRGRVAGLYRNGVAALSHPDNRHAAKAYGLDKLMPVIVIIAVVSMLYVTMVVSRFIGNLMPPYLIYRTDLLLASRMPHERVAFIWAQFPDVQGVGDLARVIDRGPTMTADEQKKLTDGAKYWADTVGVYNDYLLVGKFLVVMSLICLIGAVGRVTVGQWFGALFRTVAVLIVLGLAEIYFIGRYYYAVEQLWYAKVDGLYDILAERKAVHPAGDDLTAINDKLRSELSSRAGEHERWWDVRFVDRYYASWLMRTFWPPWDAADQPR